MADTKFNPEKWYTTDINGNKYFEPSGKSVTSLGISKDEYGMVLDLFDKEVDYSKGSPNSLIDGHIISNLMKIYNTSDNEEIKTRALNKYQSYLDCCARETDNQIDNNKYLPFMPIHSAIRLTETMNEPNNNPQEFEELSNALLDKYYAKAMENPDLFQEFEKDMLQDKKTRQPFEDAKKRYEQRQSNNSGDRTMANDNLGTYHDLFFKLGGCEKTKDEFIALSEEKEINAIKEKYAEWVDKYKDLLDNINSSNGDPTKEAEAENKYFQAREDEVANAPEEEKAAKRQSLNKEYQRAGWKEIQVGIAPAHSTPIAKNYHYNPNDPEYKGKSEDELRAIFTEKLREEIEQNNQDKPKEDENEDENKNDDNTLDIKEGEDKDAPTDENEDWKADKEKFWKEHCAGFEQECARDEEDKEGLSLNITKGDKKLGSVRYSDSKHASIAGEDGKTADYSVFLGIVKDAKRNNQAINFSGQMSPEFAAKLKLACEELGVKYQNAPEGKIDANGFEDQLSEESKKKLEEYNAKQDQDKKGENSQDQNNNQDNDKSPYENYLEQFKKDLAEGKELDLSGIKDEKEKIIAYSAAMVAMGSSMDLDKKDNREKITAYQDVAAKDIKGAPDKRIDFEEKIAVKDEKGMLKKDENGKLVMEDNPYYDAVKDLPQEARAALIGHNQGIRQQLVDAAKAKLSNEDLRKRENEDIRRNAFRDNNHKYDENSTFNTKADREARQAAMQKYWESQRSNG